MAPSHCIDVIEMTVPPNGAPGQKLLRMARDGRLVWITLPEDAVSGKRITIHIGAQEPQSSVMYAKVLATKEQYRNKLRQWKAKRGGERAASSAVPFTEPRPTPPIYYPIPTMGCPP